MSALLEKYGLHVWQEDGVYVLLGNRVPQPGPGPYPGLFIRVERPTLDDEAALNRIARQMRVREAA